MDIIEVTSKVYKLDGFTQKSERPASMKSQMQHFPGILAGCTERSQTEATTNVDGQKRAKGFDNPELP